MPDLLLSNIIEFMTIQIDIDEKVLAEVDEAIEFLEENREDAFREAFLELAKRKK